MPQADMIAQTLNRDLAMMKRLLEDLSDADLITRPVPGANHAIWQLGHLVLSEAHLVNAAQPGAVPPPPALFVEKFKKDNAKIDDPNFFPKKAEILEAMTNGRNATVAWVKSLSPEDFDRPITGPTARFADSIGLMLVNLPWHDAMHAGQIQVLRRKLGKPVLM